MQDEERTEGSTLALVHEELVAFPGEDNVPGVDGAGGAHEHADDGVGREDLGLVLGGELGGGRELALGGHTPTGRRRPTCWMMGSSEVVGL